MNTSQWCGCCVLIIDSNTVANYCRALKDWLREGADPVYTDLTGDRSAVAEFKTAEDVQAVLKRLHQKEFHGLVLQLVAMDVEPLDDAAMNCDKDTNTDIDTNNRSIYKTRGKQTKYFKLAVTLLIMII